MCSSRREWRTWSASRQLLDFFGVFLVFSDMICPSQSAFLEISDFFVMFLVRYLISRTLPGSKGSQEAFGLKLLHETARKRSEMGF